MTRPPGRRVEDRALEQVVADRGEHERQQDDHALLDGRRGQDRGQQDQDREVPQVDPVGDVAQVAADRVGEEDGPAGRSADPGREHGEGSDRRHQGRGERDRDVGYHHERGRDDGQTGPRQRGSH